MCAIFGVVKLGSSAPIDRKACDAMTKLMTHRGPDASGTWHEEQFSFGHCRLSIIDVSSNANQPMIDAAGSVVTTFNGEIYNYRELRRALSESGSRFRTQSDTEVVLEAYKRWGIACVSYLNGMFAFALYDRRRHQLHLVRDRVGIKPLYYAIIGDLLVFASEPKAIIGFPGFTRRLNVAAIASYLFCRHPGGSASYFTGLHQLSPGSHLSCDRGRISIRRYWDLRKVAAGGAQTRPRKQDIQSLLEEAIRSHLVSDVPIATLLSGGLDSSVIAAESARAGERTKCFTAQIPGELYDESSYAREVAASYRLEHRIVSIPELRDFAEVQSLIRIKDQPLGMHNEVAIYKLAQAVAKEAKVVLCGEGADEIFWGYGRIFRLPFDFARRRLFESLGPLIGPHLFKKAEISEDECGLSQVETFIYRYAYFPERLLATLLRPEWRAAFTRDSEHRAIVQEEFETSRHLSFADGLSLFFICHHLPGLLGMIDAMTMAASLEARVPFTDHRLIEAVFRLHPREKIRWRSPVHFLAATFLPVAKFSESCDVTKYALRNTYARYLPPITVNRRKMAFPTPLTESLGRPGSLAYRLLVTPNARITEWFDARAVARWFETGATLPTESFGRQLWMLLNLELFLTEYFAA